MDFSFLTVRASQFWHMTSGVCRAVGRCLGRGGRPATLSQELVMAVHRRVTRVQNKLLALMERVRAGRQVGGRSWATPIVAACETLRVFAQSQLVLPRRFGWLVHLVGYQAAGRGSQLAYLLGDPEMVALLRDVPRARRILVPLCRMLGVAFEAAPAARRTRVRPVAALRDVTKVVPKPVAPVQIGYMPSARWPRGVITRGSGRLKPA